jgi:hypothetical protein
MAADMAKGSSTLDLRSKMFSCQAFAGAFFTQ